MLGLTSTWRSGFTFFYKTKTAIKNSTGYKRKAKQLCPPLTICHEGRHHDDDDDTVTKCCEIQFKISCLPSCLLRGQQWFHPWERLWKASSTTGHDQRSVCDVTKQGMQSERLSKGSEVNKVQCVAGKCALSSQRRSCYSLAEWK